MMTSRSRLPLPRVWVVGACLALGMGARVAQGQDLRFDVASVKPIAADAEVMFRPFPPDGIVYDASLAVLVSIAYGVEDFRIEGLPAWAAKERFSVTAKATRPISNEERQGMLQTLLRERFGFRGHIEPRAREVFILSAARSDRRRGPAMKARPRCERTPCEGGGQILPGRLTLQAASTAQLARALSYVHQQVVIDETQIRGLFDFDLSWRPEGESGFVASSADTRPSFFTAIQEQLGLKMAPQQRPADTLVVEQVERPTAD